jgi:hypothetical protein
MTTPTQVPTPAEAENFIKALWHREPVAILDVVKYAVTLAVFLIPHIPTDVASSVVLTAGTILTAATRGKTAPVVKL